MPFKRLETSAAAMQASPRRAIRFLLSAVEASGGVSALAIVIVTENVALTVYPRKKLKLPVLVRVRIFECVLCVFPLLVGDVAVFGKEIAELKDSAETFSAAKPLPSFCI